MRRLYLHMGYIIVSLTLVWLIKQLNPAAMNYQIDQITTVECIESNLSGISFNSEANTFYVISNYPEVLAEITAAGECINSYSLEGFEDTEDLFFLGQNKFLIVQERKRTLDMIELDNGVVKHLQSRVIDLNAEPNKGLEGVVYYPKTKVIHLVTELPQKILKIANWHPLAEFEKVDIVNAFWASRLMDDYSAITDTGTGLMLLSHESNRLLELDYDGEVKAVLNLIDESQALNNFVQAEGIAVDLNDDIYIVSEPNQLHVYKKKPATGAGFLAFASD